MRLKTQVDNLEALVNDRLDSIEKVLKMLVGRADIIALLQDRISDLKQVNREFLDRLMARDFETFQTYTAGGEEKVGEELKPEESEEMAGEIFKVEK